GIDDYGSMMTQVFREVARVIKPDGLATVVFHSARSAVWQALAAAYQEAGFEVRATSVLDKLQASFKQVVSTVSVKGDPLLLLSRKTRGTEEEAPIALDIVIADVMRQAQGAEPAERNPQRLYSRF